MSIMRFFLIFLLPSLAFSIDETVNTPSGTVIGSTTNYQNIKVIQFLGIPFAKPPVGDLRFRKPRPVEGWTTPILAKTFPPACVQFFPFEYPWVDNLPGQSEDCLYLNIWAPANGTKRNPKAVLFWMFSGGFTLGSNRKPVYNGAILAAKGDVIVVTINYRLGILGFLSTETDDAPGNMGLFDALEALKWVNNNVHAFGGDRNQITISGHSAGSILSGYLYVSPLAKGLFQQAIMESGSPLMLLGDSKEKNLKLGQKVAKAVGCASKSVSLQKNPHDVLDCLRTKDAKQLVVTTNSFMPTSTVNFAVIIDDEFLPTYPRVTLLQGNFQNISILIGVVEDEGSFVLASQEPQTFGPFGELDPKINKSHGENLILKGFKDFDFKHDVANYYLGGLRENDYDEVRSQAYHSLGDFDLICPAFYFAESVSRKDVPVYFYYYTHRRSTSPWAPWMGVAHFDEVPLVFGRPLDTVSIYTAAEKKLSTKLIRLWSNFIKYGIPSWNWEKYSPPDNNIKHLRIAGDNDDYLGSHLTNCDFFRKYFGF